MTKLIGVFKPRTKRAEELLKEIEEFHHRFPSYKG